MSHPRTFDPDDPYLERLREICLSLPGAAEKISHGRPWFFTRKAFAVFGGMQKGTHSYARYGQSVLVLPDRAERDALLADPRFFDPAYLGPSGWVGLDLTAGAADRVATATDWAEVAELVDASYRNTAPVTLVRQLPDR